MTNPNADLQAMLARKEVWCPKCRCMVSKWHKHWGVAEIFAAPRVEP